MIILGISAWFHDAAAAIIRDGEVIAAAEEERFTRIKHDPDFPANAIAWCLEFTGLHIDELDAVVFYEKPFLKFERILESFYAIAPRGLGSFMTAMPHWFGEKLFIKNKLIKGLKKIQPFDQNRIRLLFPEHHVSHAAGTFRMSGLSEAAILTVDGVGEWATTTISHAKDGQLHLLAEMRFPHSVGLLYSAFTQSLGFQVNEGEYKLMGLAAYGDPESEQTRQFRELILEHLVTVFDDGSIELNLPYFGFLSTSQTIRPAKWHRLFAMPPRKPKDPMTTDHACLAQAIQLVTEDILLKLATTARQLTGSQNLCLSGGVALNCVANGRLQRSDLFEHLFVQPAPGDSGAAIGAALAAEMLLSDLPIPAKATPLPLFGPPLQISDPNHLLADYPLRATQMEESELMNFVAEKLDRGHIIGWCQGRMEFGPRALGNRSILGDPRHPEMQRRINLDVKRRESFRPFAPAILEEELDRYFGTNEPSGWMQFVHPLTATHRLPVPDGFRQLDITAQLSAPKSVFPAITHADFSARIQTVNREAHPRFYQLLQAFFDRTGCPMLVNTSFNLRGEPIVCTAEDAILCFLQTDLDLLVLDNVVLERDPDRFGE